jgi:hypothetical protein
VNINDPDFHEVGAALAQHSSEQAEFSARGIIGELFPYIYQASRRMSTRAISRWLAEGPKIKLSAVSIAKALRNPEKYWEEFAESIEPQARIVQDALDWPMEDFLYKQEGFEHLVSDPKTRPVITGDSDSELQNSYFEYESAVEFLRQKWFSLDSAARGNCWKYFHSKEEEEK